MTKSLHHKSPICTNCSYVFHQANNYCPVCGQKNHELRLPLKHLFEEVLESTLHLDSKSVRTMKLLVLKPGMLSREFNAGKRAEYVPPIRLYVFISFVFFFLLNVLTGGHKNESVEDAARRDAARNRSQSMVVSFAGITSKELAGVPSNRIDSVLDARKIERSALNTYMIGQMHRLANNNAGEFSHIVMKNISYMMFLLMPVFAGWIYLFNRKRLRYYIESLIISIHFHSYIFLIFTVLLVASAIAGMELFILLLIVIVPIYMLLMLRRAIGQGWLMTGGKTFVIGLLYLASLATMLLWTVLVSVALI